MNKQESLELYARGRRAWNKWAEELLVERKALEEAVQPILNPGKDIRDWQDRAKADFSGHHFEEDAEFSSFIFPGEAEFNRTDEANEAGGLSVATVFSGIARFNKVYFHEEANFEHAVFEDSALFQNAIFSDNCLFLNVRFDQGALFSSVRIKLDADFTSTLFKGRANFSGAKISGGLLFDTTLFEGKAYFNNAEIKGHADFVESTFNSETQFNKTIFNEMAWFSDAKFNNHTNFEGTIFHDLAYFKDVLFGKKIRFTKANFQDVNFTDGKFVGETWFDDSEFHGNTWFNQTVFRGHVNFSQASFFSFATFHKTQFDRATSFNAIRAERAFTLEDASFKVVPDFIQAHFEEAPRLDNVTVPQSQFLASYQSNNSANMSALWRALKRLAIQGHDHERELQFFAEEIRAQQTWIGYFYELLSDFGRSLWLPFIWWCASVGVMTLVHFLTSSLSRSSLNLFDTLGAAFHLAFTKGLLVLGWGASDKLADDYSLLYGVAKSASGEATVPSIPYPVDFMQMGQAIVSAVLIFLFLLALRNRFRIN